MPAGIMEWGCMGVGGGRGGIFDGTGGGTGEQAVQGAAGAAQAAPVMPPKHACQCLQPQLAPHGTQPYTHPSLSRASLLTSIQHPVLPPVLPRSRHQGE